MPRNRPRPEGPLVSACLHCFEPSTIRLLRIRDCWDPRSLPECVYKSWKEDMPFANAAICRVLCILAMSVATAQATIVIALRDANMIIIGADSLVVRGKERPHECKVFQHKDTVAGISGTFNPELGFDLPAITRQIVQAERLNLSD